MSEVVDLRYDKTGRQLQFRAQKTNCDGDLEWDLNGRAVWHDWESVKLDYSADPVEAVYYEIVPGAEHPEPNDNGDTAIEGEPQVQEAQVSEATWLPKPTCRGWWWYRNPYLPLPPVPLYVWLTKAGGYCKQTGGVTPFSLEETDGEWNGPMTTL